MVYLGTRKVVDIGSKIRGSSASLVKELGKTEVGAEDSSFLSLLET